MFGGADANDVLADQQRAYADRAGGVRLSATAAANNNAPAISARSMSMATARRGGVSQTSHDNPFATSSSAANAPAAGVSSMASSTSATPVRRGTMGGAMEAAPLRHPVGTPEREQEKRAAFAAMFSNSAAAVAAATTGGAPSATPQQPAPQLATDDMFRRHSVAIGHGGRVQLGSATFVRIDGLGALTDERMVRGMCRRFAEVGEIRRVQVGFDEGTQGRVGLVEFSNRNDADRCVRSLSSDTVKVSICAAPR